MDYKLRKMAVIASLAIVVLIGLVVIRMNRAEKPRGNMKDRTQVPTTNSEESSAREPGQIGENLKAFEKDSTFFDADKNPYLEKMIDQTERLSLFVTSVEKDLRIRIYDYTERPVTGQDFLVKLEGVGEYRDLDKDGVIYIDGLSAGEYYVSLQPVKGYRIPEEAIRIRVKDQVEHTAIEDISYFIKTEEEIHAQEDTGVSEITGDGDKTEIASLKAATDHGKAGIDVSKKQGKIDWEKVRESGVEFAIIRAGYRESSTGMLVEDPFFKANMRGAALQGIPTGVYFTSYAVNEVEAVEEASAVLELIKDFRVKYPVFLDIEGTRSNVRTQDLDSETRTFICEAFCETICNSGYRAGVYARKSSLQNNTDTQKIDAQKLGDYSIWLAEYRSVPSYGGYYEFWQHSSKGSVNGISGAVDLNISFWNAE